jgi:hypothetical protein
MAVDCLDTIVGLTDIDCDCPDNSGRPVNYSTSTSGYYITDADGFGFPNLNAALAAADCGQSDVWDVLTQARSRAIQQMQTELLTALATNYENRVKRWDGAIGKVETIAGTSAKFATHGLQVRPKRIIKDGKFVLTAVRLGLQATESVTVNITSNNPDFTPDSVVISCVDGTFVRASKSLELPFYSKGVSPIYYNFQYQSTGSPIKNRIYCCSTPVWRQDMEAGGIATDDFDNDLRYGKSEAQGLILEGYYTCERLDWICRLTELNGLDFRDLLARQVQLLSAIWIINKLLSDPNPTRFNTMDREQLYRARSTRQKRYNDNMTWIAQNLPGDFSDCWTCKEEDTFFSGTL